MRRQLERDEIMSRVHIACAAALLFLAGSAPAFAIGPTGLAAPAQKKILRIAAAKPTLAPFAFVSFCVAHGDECRTRNSASTLVLTPNLLRELKRVNVEVNNTIIPMNDAPGRDSWDIDVRYGDCEDYVLTKRSRLAKLGWPENKLRVAVAMTRNNNGHAVLVVSTDKGDLVLDNRNDEIKNWQDTDLRWLKIQSDENPMFWNEVSAGR